MRVRRLALIFLLTLMAPAIQAWPSEVLTASAGGAGISLLSKSQWSETFTDSNHLSYHLVGEVRNDTGGNVSGVALQLNLFDSLGNYKGSHTTPATVRVLAPGERSPFEYVLFTPPPDYTRFTVTQPIPFAVSVGQPDHNFITTPDPCPPPPDCQGHVNGSVQNPNSAPPVQGVGVIFTFYDGTGAIVSQNRLDISNAAGGTSLAPGEIGRYALDRTGEPTWSSRAFMVEPDYPIDVNPTSLNFGNKRLGVTSATEDVAVFNSGSDPITISSATASGDFAVAGLSCTTIAPLSSCRVSITFTPTAMGARTGTLTITENVAGSPQLIPLGGTGVAPVLTLDTNTLNFGPQAVGTTSAAKTVTITNTGSDTLNITAMSTSGDYASSTCPASLAPTASCVVSITFSPQAGGPRNGTLTIQDDAAGSPHTVQLNGTGLGPGVAFSPPGLDFGPVSMGTTSSGRTVQLTNSGSAALTITSVTASGDFQSTDNCPRGPATLAAGNSCTITVTFTPTAPGARTGTLTVTDNAGDSPQLYGLKGLGAKATYTAAITTQARLTSSDGATWQPVDPALALTIKVPDSEAALLSGNADLWTATRGVNQDLGITVTPADAVAYPSYLIGWKESGGYAGTFSPNAAAIEAVFAMPGGTSYTATLVWKTNKASAGAAYAGAGQAPYSPTRLTAVLTCQ